jgi:hypothetical protein
MRVQLTSIYKPTYMCRVVLRTKMSPSSTAGVEVQTVTQNYVMMHDSSLISHLRVSELQPLELSLSHPVEQRPLLSSFGRWPFDLSQY